MKKLLLTLFLGISLNLVFAQNLSTDKNWQNLDPKNDKIMGVSSDLAYNSSLKNKKSKTIVVAIIDSGTDIFHEDLKDNIWTNTKEIAGNGIDDDKNGYIDDIHGWSFLGNTKGENITSETLELTRIYGKYKKRFEGKDENSISPSEKEDYKKYQEFKKKYEKQLKDNRDQLAQVKQFATFYYNSTDILKEHFKKDTLTYDFLKSQKVKDKKLSEIIKIYKSILKQGFSEKELDEYLDHFKKAINYSLNPDYNARDSIIGDNPEIIDNKAYGTNDVTGHGASHGTHVAGIIGAVRDNNIGMNGIAQNVKLMIIRAVPNGDERDKDVALAIRYAADNGAKIINMSFGKPYSPQKELVDAAVRHADSLGVLMIHAAGNDNKNLDKEDSYPTPYYLNGEKAVNWLTIGASRMKKGKKIPAGFSNYGKTKVDLFAPGFDIYSCIPGNKYEKESGTSMAAPTTSGVAALVWSYFPELTATELKTILMNSVTDVSKKKVIIPGEKKKKIRFGELCVSGGILNAEKAIELAEKTTKEKN